MDKGIYSGNRVFYYDALRAFAIFGVLSVMFLQNMQKTQIYSLQSSSIILFFFIP